jgi:hypothetical protein
MLLDLLEQKEPFLEELPYAILNNSKMNKRFQWKIFLVEETRAPVENHRPVASD